MAESEFFPYPYGFSLAQHLALQMESSRKFCILKLFQCIFLREIPMSVNLTMRCWKRLLYFKFKGNFYLQMESTA